jgi:hypothetical protein
MEAGGDELPDATGGLRESIAQREMLSKSTLRVDK